MIKFEKGVKIEIFDEYFIVCKVTKSFVELETKNPNIISSKLLFIGPQLVLVTERIFDCKLDKKGFRYNNKNYQIINQEKKETYSGGKWSRLMFSHIKLVGEEDSFDRKIICEVGGKCVFNNFERIEEKDITFNPKEIFEENVDTNNKKIKIKIKDLP